jgi:diaminopimelate decarboxylase
MEIDYKKAKKQVMMFHFENLSSLQKFEEKNKCSSKQTKRYNIKYSNRKNKAINEYTKNRKRLFVLYE